MARPRLARASGNASRKAATILVALVAFSPAPARPESVAFGPRSTPDGATLFSELPAERTGIVTTNRYDDPRMWGQRHIEYQVGAMGTGVAIGDYDRDGRPDVFIVSKIEPGRLFRNLGGWRFEDVTAAAGVEDASGEWKQGAAFADVDNDGLLDLYVCRFGAPNQLYMNRGDGTFREEAAARGLAIIDASGMGCFADYDGDGWLDVYLQTNLWDASRRPEGQRDRLLRNNGDGTFRDVTDAVGILDRATQGHSAVWWDHDEDGRPDLYVANDFGPPDFLYRNNGDGTFSDVIDAVVPHTTFSSMGSDLGDVNNDGHIDFFVADMAGTTHEKNQRGMADSRGKANLAQNELGETAVQQLYNALYLNTGRGRCLEAAHLAGLDATNWTWSPRFEDLDQDGWLDLYVTNGMDREQNNLDLISRRLSALSPLERIRVAKDSPVLREANLAFANRGGLRFEEVGKAWGLDHYGVSFGSAFGDLDGDGDLDVVFTNFQDGATVLRNDGQLGNSIILELRGTASNRHGIGARVEAVTASGLQVRQLVLARGYLSTSEPVVHFGLGSHAEVERLTITWPSGRVQTLGPLPSGRRYIVTEPAGDQPRPPAAPRPAPLFEEISSALGVDFAQREEALEGTVAQPLLTRRFNRRGPGLAVGDLDGDGSDELVVAATVRDGARILRSVDGRYHEVDTGAMAASPAVNGGVPLVFDADGDGANDVLLTAGGAALPAEEPEYQPVLWLNRGGLRFEPAPEGALPPVPTSTGAAVAADFDRDGRLDVFLGGRVLPGFFPEAPRSALLLNGGGRFTDATKRWAPGLEEVGMVTSALASDVDDDGWVDLVVAVEWGGVRLFRNREGRGFDDVSTAWGFDSAGSGLWTSLAAADFNGDGRLDYAVGNLGLNTPYTASRGHPLRLYAGDFAGRGEPQLIEAQDIDGASYPLLSRAEIGAKIPAVLKRLPSNDRFAKATIEEVLGREALAKARTHQVDELRSGVLLSGSPGRFGFVALERHAQIAPIQGMAAGDFDADGRVDLLVAGNDYSPSPVVGRWDGGLGWLLRGDGAGAFIPVPLEQSGWMVSGNAKALALLDLDRDARPDAIVSRNNQPARAFRLQGFGECQPLAVRLRGRGGNRDAVGARVMVERGGHLLGVGEVRAGGGYSSQDTTTLFFAIPPPRHGDGPPEVSVRWPLGRTTRTTASADVAHLLIDEE